MLYIIIEINVLIIKVMDRESKTSRANFQVGVRRARGRGFNRANRGSAVYRQESPAGRSPTFDEEARANAEVRTHLEEVILIINLYNNVIQGRNK